MEPGDGDKPDWDKIPVVGAGDIRHTVSPTLILLGSAQHPTYAHPKLLGQCYDNVYHQGHLIGDLPAQGKQPTEAQTKKIYDQEYEELVAMIENTLDLSLQSKAYPMVLTSLLNPDIVFPPKFSLIVISRCQTVTRWTMQWQHVHWVYKGLSMDTIVLTSFPRLLSWESDIWSFFLKFSIFSRFWLICPFNAAQLPFHFLAA